MARPGPIPAKLVRPAQVGTFRRNRLFSLLDRAGPVAWVSGPPGMGKTTLVASYVEARRLKPIWYQVDAGDGDVAALFYYLRRAALRAAPRKHWRLPLLTPEYLDGLATFARRWFEELFGGLPRPLVLVFDNYQEAPEHSRLHEVLREAFDVLRGGDRAIVMSRSDPPPALARLRAAGAIALVEAEALRLTAAETCAIARARTRRRVRTEQGRALHEATDGWAAGLVLMLEHASADTGIAVQTRRTPQAIFDYFASEILARSDAETQQVLVETAFLSKITAAQAEALTGSTRAAEILAELARRRYFTDIHVDPDPTYQYHPLFREFLLNRGKQVLSPGRCNEVRRLAATLLQQGNRIEEAALLLRQSENWDGLARLVAAHAATLLAHGRSETVYEWLRSLPSGFLDASPLLLYWLAACRIGVEPEECLRHASRAFDGFRAAGDRAGMLSGWCMAVDAIFYGWGDLTRLDPWIETLESLLREQSDFPSEALESQVTASMLTALVWRQPGHRDMARWVERAESTFHGSPDTGCRLRAGHALAMHFVWGGEIHKAETITKTLSSMVGGGTAVLPRLWAMAVESTVAWIRADPGRCRRISSEGLSLARSAGVHIIDDQLTITWVFGALVGGDLAPAIETLDQIRSVVDDRKYAVVLNYHYLRGWASMLAGDVEAAQAHAETALNFAERVGWPFSIVVCRVALGQTLHERGEIRRAHEELNQALRLAMEIGSRTAECCCLLAEAFFAIREGNESGSLPWLTRAFGLLRNQGLLTIAWWLPKTISRLCTKALQWGIEVEYARRLVEAHHLLPDPEDPPPETWPWPIRVSALGGFEVAIEDRPLIFPAKGQRKPLELLQAMVAFGGDGVAEKDLADALWPDADGDAAHQSLTVTLHRLRRLLRHDEAIQRHGGRVDLDPKHVWIDVRELQTCLERAVQAPREARPRFIDAALQLYRGPLLAGNEEKRWILGPRQRLHAGILRRLAEMGRDAEAAGEPEQAAGWYSRALEIDPCAEEIYRRLMTLHQRLGRRAEALAVYERCRKMLAANLGVSPSSETGSILSRPGASH
jgi:LuxR family maltose regulon positive regulatory protein